jgi:hypothetical protein
MVADRKYQVFVSSTYEDLQQERQEVMHALLELDCMPAGMELFPAADEDQWTLIKRVIDECDYYIVIVAGRYGSVGSSGMSYTEMEYRYALEQGKPIIAFLHKDPGTLMANRTEGTAELKAKLDSFREFCRKKVCKFWTTPAELGSVVSRSLVQLMKSRPALGWVRGDVVTDQQAAGEILKLRKQIEELQATLNKVTTQLPAGAEGLARGDDTFEVHYTFKARHRTTYATTNYSATFHPTWNDLFAAVAPHFIDEANEEAFRNALDEYAESANIAGLNKDKDLKNQSLSEFEIRDDDFQTIKVQLRALGLIARSDRQRSLRHAGTYWTLTPYGDTLMTQLRAIRREEKETSNEEENGDAKQESSE